MLLDEVKQELRISDAEFDTEISELISEAFADLAIPPIKTTILTETEPLVKRAVKLYVKANFGLDNPDAEKYQKAYDNLVQKLSLSLKYKEVMSE